MNESKKVLGLDIGGSSIKAGLVDVTNGRLVEKAHQVPLPKPSTPDNVVTAIRDIVEHFSWQGAVGCGYPGVIRHGVARSAANVSREWLGVNILDRLEAVSNGRAAVINDADAAGLAEMRFGAGQKRNQAGGGTVLVMTLGTGIGTAFFHDGRLFPNTEFGHVHMENGREAEDQAAASIRVDENLSWEVWGRRLDAYLHEMDKLISPDLIVIGGGISEEFAKFSDFLSVECDVSPARMTNDAGIIGAALAVTQ
jgi:polyphosphate glucokinase